MFNFGYLLSLLYWYLRPAIKWVLHRMTCLCELQRLCYGAKPGSQRTKAVEHSLQLSKSIHIQRLVAELNKLSSEFTINVRNRSVIVQGAIDTILNVKNIDQEVHPLFARSFGKCVEQIWGYRQLYHEVELRRTEQYDSDNLEHEAKLYRLWALLVPESELESRITKQWQHIGFQGDDPKTDFRGMGMLGLENLLYFAEEHQNASKQVLSHSLHPKYGYTFAIVGINLTSMAYRLFKDGAAKTHIYNISKTLPNIKSFHQLYSYLFYEFDKHWVESKPESIMDFSFIQERFENNIRIALADPSTIFKLNFGINNI